MSGSNRHTEVRLGYRNLDAVVVVDVAIVDSIAGTSAKFLLYESVESTLDYPHRIVLLVGSKSSTDMPQEL